MIDVDLGVLLTVPIHATVSLLHPVRIPRNLVVNELPAVVLEIDALRGGVRRQQNPDGRFRRVGLKSGLDPLAILRSHAAVDGQQTIRAPQFLGGE